MSDEDLLTEAQRVVDHWNSHFDLLGFNNCRTSCMDDRYIVDLVHRLRSRLAKNEVIIWVKSEDWK